MKTYILVLFALLSLPTSAFAGSNLDVSGAVIAGSFAKAYNGVDFNPTTCHLRVNASNWSDPERYEQSIMVSFENEAGLHTDEGVTFYLSRASEILPVFGFSKSNASISLKDSRGDEKVTYQDGRLKIFKRSAAASVDTGINVGVGGWIGGKVRRVTAVNYSNIVWDKGILTLQTVQYNALDPIGISGVTINKSACRLSLPKF